MSSKAQSGAQDGGTDLGTLWTAAVQDYCKKTGKDLSRDLSARSMADAIKATESSLQSFQGFRHKGDKVDKVRSAFGRHLDGMQKCMNGIQMVGAAAGAFPPAMPVGLVFAACGHVLSAFAGVKADYDKVEDFFMHSSRFFERLSIIENKVSDSVALAKGIVRVFSAQLSVCAIVEAMVKTKAARFKQFLSALWNLEDPDLNAAYASMQASIEELGQAVGYASYAEIKSTQAITVTISAKADAIDENIRKFRDQLSQDVHLVYESQLDMRAEIIDGFRATQEMYRQQQRLEEERDRQYHDSLMKAIQSLKPTDAGDKDKRKQNTKGGGKGDPGDKKFKAVKSIKEFFDRNEDRFPLWRAAHKENASQETGMKNDHVPNTADWITDDAAFQQWTEGKNPLLWVKGTDGIGKSFIAHASIEKLQARDNGANSVAYFYFKEDYSYLQFAENAMACAALQVAETNIRYAEQIAVKLRDDGENATSTPTWERFFLTVFGASSGSDHLYIVFDGLDEAPKDQQRLLLEFLKGVTTTKSRVHIMVTSRVNTEGIGELDPLTMEVTKEKILGDMRRVIRYRINTLDRLKKFSSTGKAIIRRTVLKHADGMLYIEHMMRRLWYIGREGAVLKDLKIIPNNLHDLYKLLLDDCRRNRSKDEYEALKRLFAWLAFSRRSLSLAEASELVKLTITNNDFDVEDEIIGRSARILELSRSELLGDDHPDDAKDDDSDDPGEEIVAEIEEYRKASLTFQERSLRQYFRAVSVEAHGDEELRTPASAAHLTIFKMCIDILISSAKEKVDGDAPELIKYAAGYWYEHFSELDLRSASDEDVNEVLTSMHRVLMNENNVAKVFEQYAAVDDMYPVRDGETVTPWYDGLTAWAVQGSNLENMLSDSVKTWIAEIVARPNEALLPLAKGHWNNWRLERQRGMIVEGYDFTARTLGLCGHFTADEDQPMTNVLAVGGAFGDYQNDACLRRSIGTCLDREALGVEINGNEELAKQIWPHAIEHLEKSVELTDGDGKEKGYTLRLLAKCCCHIGSESDIEKGINAQKQALQCFTLQIPPNTTEDEDEDDHWVIRQMYLDLADMLQRVGKNDGALSAYDEAKKYAGDEPLPGIHLFCILRLVRIRDEASADRQLMDTLKSWSDKDRFQWLEFCLEYGFDTADLVYWYKPAKATGETDLVLGWLNAWGKTLAPWSPSLFRLKRAIAIFYDRVLEDKAKTKEILREALAVQPKDDGNQVSDLLALLMSDIRAELASIIYSQFKETSGANRKETLLAEMKNLPGMDSDDFEESHIGMLLADMLRIMGPAREYQNTLQRIFRTCIEGLEDTVSWNDADSLRLLAKVLASLDGLERDASIALSAQFSILDRSIYEDSATGSEDSDIESVGPLDAQHPTSANPEEQRPPESNGRKDDENTENEARTSGKDSAAVNHLDEDLVGLEYSCDICQEFATSWVRPLYLCLVCTNTDLCVGCREKRLKWNREGEEEDTWTTVCGKNHHYIRGPMAGWKGIKDGVIRIGEEEVPVKQWIKELKEERWPKAWEAFWSRGSGLRDIEV